MCGIFDKGSIDDLILFNVADLLQIESLVNYFLKIIFMANIIPFKVSARTARLIGRENVATSKGAIIELVKNGYDADSPFSVVLIDNKYGVYHKELSKLDYKKLLELGCDPNLLSSIYQLDKDIYIEKLTSI